MVFACDVFVVYPDENLGVRLENTVLITETGCESLNSGQKSHVKCLKERFFFT